MKYKVEWEESATQEVAAEFVTGNDKVAIIDATHQIDRALESDPIGNGTPLDEGMFYIDRLPHTSDLFDQRGSKTRGCWAHPSDTMTSSRRTAEFIGRRESTLHFDTPSHRRSIAIRCSSIVSSVFSQDVAIDQAIPINSLATVDCYQCS